MERQRMSNLQQRVITGFFLGVLILGSIWMGPLYQGVVFSSFMLFGLWEFYTLCEGISVVRISKEMGIFIGLFIYVLLIGMSMKILPVISITLISPLFFSLILIELWKKHGSPLLNISLLLMGIIYVTIPFFLCIDLNLRNTEYLSSVAVMFILIWTNDSMAYFTGRYFGKRKLFSRISPKKTWEGTVGGVAFTIIIGVLIGSFVNRGRVDFWLVSSILISLGAIFGDLLESLFKRSLNVKDSGSILPGHGGILDRFDAALFSIPFFYCWYMLYFYW